MKNKKFRVYYKKIEYYHADIVATSSDELSEKIANEGVAYATTHVANARERDRDEWEYILDSIRLLEEGVRPPRERK